MAVACAVAVVGSGWAGTYTAWRLALSQRDVCLFEAYHRPGGRTYTTTLRDYVLDVGAYRFAGDMHLPADVIERALGFRSACYDPTCKDDDVKAEVQWPYQLPLRKIVDFDGRHLGYGAALQAMLAQFETAGGRFFPGAELQGLERSGPAWLLRFNSSGAVPLPSLELTASTALLALPRPVLLRLPGFREAMAARWPSLQCTDRDFPTTVTEGSTTTKVYAIYEDAWWVSKLSLLRGVRANLTSEPPVAIHYHDGEVICRAGARDASGRRAWRPAREVQDGTAGRECRGVLQVFYRHSQSCPSSFPRCMEFWAAQHRASLADPLTLAQGEQGEQLRQVVHAKLLAMHRADFIAQNMSQEEIEAIAKPTELAYSVWYHEGTFPTGDPRMLTGPQDLIYDPAQGFPGSCGVNSPEAFDEMVQGTGRFSHVASGLHVVNNDFAASERSAWHGPWAEQPLLAAERLLAKAFHLERPVWLNKTYYDRHIARQQGAATSYV